MNIRNVLRTYSLLRQLTDDETALLNTLRGLTDSDREQLVESLQPAKGKKAVKRPAKSRRASSLQQQIQQTPKPATTCVHEIDDNGGLMLCEAVEGDPIWQW